MWGCSTGWIDAPWATSGHMPAAHGPAVKHWPCCTGRAARLEHGLDFEFTATEIGVKERRNQGLANIAGPGEPQSVRLSEGEGASLLSVRGHSRVDLKDGQSAPRDGLY